MVISDPTLTTLRLDWVPSVDNSGSVSYQVYRDNILLATTPDNFLDDSNLSPNQSYAYYVYAVDGSGNLSLNATSTEGSTLADQTPPDVPTGVSAAADSASSITVSWDASQDNVATAGYYLDVSEQNNFSTFVPG